MTPTESITITDVLQLLVLPVILPAIVGLATRWEPVGNLPTLAKRLILALLALASQILTEFLQATTNGVGYTLDTFYWSLFLGAVAILGAELSYQGLYKAPISKVPTFHQTSKGYEVVPARTLATVIGGKK